MSEKLDIFETLKEMDKGNISFIENLPLDKQKGFVPLLTMRWASSGSPKQLQLINSIVNPLVFKLHKHPKLMYLLLTACSDGKAKRYSWIKKKSKDKRATVSVTAVAQYYDISKTEAIRCLPRLSLEDVVDMAEDLGYDKEQIKKIKTELK